MRRAREVLAWLDGLRAEAEREAERHGPMRGRIRPAQRPWSSAIDLIEHERQLLVEEAA